MNQAKLIATISFTLIVGTLLGVTLFSVLNPNPIKELDIGGNAPEFTLPSFDGTNYSLSDDLGKVVVLTFLFTRCQMGCALISSNMATVRDILVDNNQMDQVKFITIDFDYKYDEMSDLVEYANIYSDSSAQWQFLLGDQNQTDEVVDDYDFYYEEEGINMTLNGVDLGPSYVHLFAVYLIDPLGRLRTDPLYNGGVKFYVGGIDWKPDELYYPIDFLLNE